MNEKQSYSVIVDYSQPITEMIEAGKYDGVNSNITKEHFPQPQGEGVKEVDLILVHLNRWANIKEVGSEIKKQVLRPGSLAELLAFGAKYPDVQKRFPIAAIGSVWVTPDGYRCVPYIDEDWGGGRRLYLYYWCGRGWYGYWRFLAAPLGPLGFFS